MGDLAMFYATESVGDHCRSVYGDFRGCHGANRRGTGTPYNVTYIVTCPPKLVPKWTDTILWQRKGISCVKTYGFGLINHVKEAIVYEIGHG